MAEKLREHSLLEPVLTALSAGKKPDKKAPVTIREIPFQGQFVIRALEDLERLNAALEPVLGVPLNDTPNHVVHSENGHKIFWLRAGQWLLVTAPDKAAPLRKKLENALSGRDSNVVDNSDGATCLRLSGDRARDVLQKGCPLDVHPRVFPVESMAQTRIVHAGIFLHHADEDEFDIYIRNSFAEYLLRWLYDAALEYGVEVRE